MLVGLLVVAAGEPRMSLVDEALCSRTNEVRRRRYKANERKLGEVVPQLYVSGLWNAGRARRIEMDVSHFATAAWREVKRWQSDEGPTCSKGILPQQIRATSVEEAATTIQNKYSHWQPQLKNPQQQTPFYNLFGRSQLRTNASVVAPPDGEANESTIANMTLVEVACSLSHLTAIRRAYEAGEDSVLVTEDDVTFERFDFAFFHAITEAMRHVADWALVVQLYTMGAPSTRRGLLALEPRRIVRGYGYGTLAYVINRACMSRVLDQAAHFDASTMSEADTLVYTHCRPYMVSRPMVTHRLVASMIHPTTAAKHQGTADKAEREYETALAIERGEAGIKHSYCPLRARDFTKATLLDFQDRYVRNVYCLLRDCPSSSQGSNTTTRTFHPPGTYLSPCPRKFTSVHQATNPREW